MKPGGAGAADRSARLEELLARTALSDQGAFAELYRTTSSHPYGAALRFLRDRPAAVEALQDAFVAIWHHAASDSVARSQPRTWLTAVVRNRCLDALRKRELDTVSMTSVDEHDSDLDLPAEGGSPADLLMAGADPQSVRECVELSLEAVSTVNVPPDRTLELWALPEVAAPRSLGMLPASGTGRVTLPEAALRGIPALAISLEPAGGSPTGAPTGPVLYSGRVERI